MHHPTGSITHHGLCYTSRRALAGTRNSSMCPPHEGSIRRPIAPWANALTTELHLATLTFVGCSDESRDWKAVKRLHLIQWFLTWVQSNPRGSLSQSQGFDRGQEIDNYFQHWFAVNIYLLMFLCEIHVLLVFFFEQSDFVYNWCMVRFVH